MSKTEIMKTKKTDLVGLVQKMVDSHRADLEMLAQIYITFRNEKCANLVGDAVRQQVIAKIGDANTGIEELVQLTFYVKRCFENESYLAGEIVEKALHLAQNNLEKLTNILIQFPMDYDSRTQVVHKMMKLIGKNIEKLWDLFDLISASSGELAAEVIEKIISLKKCKNLGQDFQDHLFKHYDEPHFRIITLKYMIANSAKIDTDCIRLIFEIINANSIGRMNYMPIAISEERLFMTEDEFNENTSVKYPVFKQTFCIFGVD